MPKRQVLTHSLEETSQRVINIVVWHHHQQVELFGQQPPIFKLDGALATLTNCKHLSLSTNNIDKIERLTGLTGLRVLSLGRNQIKKLEGLDALADTLQELWISYNLLEKLVTHEYSYSNYAARLAPPQNTGWH